MVLVVNLIEANVLEAFESTTESFLAQIQYDLDIHPRLLRSSDFLKVFTQVCFFDQKPFACKR